MSHPLRRAPIPQPGRTAPAQRGPSVAAPILQLHRLAGNRAVTRLVLQRAVGWTDASTKVPGARKWNDDEHPVGKVRRIPLEGLKEGTGASMSAKDQKGWQDIPSLTSEKAIGKAIVLVPDDLDAGKSIEVVVFLHGHTEGDAPPVRRLPDARPDGEGRGQEDAGSAPGHRPHRHRAGPRRRARPVRAAARGQQGEAAGDRAAAGRAVLAVQQDRRQGLRRHALRQRDRDAPADREEMEGRQGRGRRLRTERDAHRHGRPQRRRGGALAHGERGQAGRQARRELGAHQRPRDLRRDQRLGAAQRVRGVGEAAPGRGPRDPHRPHDRRQGQARPPQHGAEAARLHDRLLHRRVHPARQGDRGVVRQEQGRARPVGGVPPRELPPRVRRRPPRGADARLQRRRPARRRHRHDPRRDQGCSIPGTRRPARAPRGRSRSRSATGRSTPSGSRSRSRRRRARARARRSASRRSSAGSSAAAPPGRCARSRAWRRSGARRS